MMSKQQCPWCEGERIINGSRCPCCEGFGLVGEIGLRRYELFMDFANYPEEINKVTHIFSRKQVDFDEEIPF